MSFTSPSDARWSEVYISAVARAISTCGDMLAATALLLVFQERGRGGIAVAALLLAAAVPPVVLAPIAGRVADRFDSRHILVIVGCAQVAACVVLAYATSLIVIVGLVTLLEAGMSVIAPTVSALTPAMVGRDNLAKAGAIGQTAGTIGMLIAPVLGGVLVGAFGAHVPLLIDAATYLAIPFVGFALRTRRRGGQTPSETHGDVVDVSWSVWRDSLIRPLLILFAAVIAAASMINVVDVFFVRGTLHSSTTMYGVVGACWFIGMMVGSAVLARRNPSDARLSQLMLAMLAGTTLVITCIATVPNVAWLLPLMLIGGVTNGAENVAAGVLIGRRAPEATRGHAFAMFFGTMNGASAFGYVIAGLLLSVADPRMILLGTGVIALALVIPFAPPLLRAARRERAATATPAPAAQLAA
jgi:MFS family permease